MKKATRCLTNALLTLMAIGITGFSVHLPAHAQDYSWQKPHAKVLPHGDLEYAPEPYQFRPEGEVRYIDFENGNDVNAGTKAAAWKHHPWDPNASGKA